ncbi:hypothetical protein [Sigmofec virus UA08Rod_4124]|uniref:Uncharacterized protein n=1 Tax=Sigmofec virus UA08Rod_4124 TaxID=2929395 RepID=A0A976R732_9VIRU|nr:hypothetical protein [Sigmofec virus UA08Rod_4124]
MEKSLKNSPIILSSYVNCSCFDCKSAFLVNVQHPSGCSEVFCTSSPDLRGLVLDNPDCVVTVRVINFYSDIV